MGRVGAAWRAVSLLEKERRPIFVVGVPRSGTTALRNTLERHPRFAPRQPGTAETRVFVRPQRILQILEPEGAALLEFFLGDREAAGAMLEQARAVRGPRWSLRRLHPWCRAGHDHLVRVFFHHARKARGVARVVEKTPAHALHLEELRLTYPRARIVACVRHPVDVYSSYRKRLERSEERGKYRDGLSWLAADPAAFAREYAEIADALCSARSHDPARVHWLRYEALTEDADAELRVLCDFLGERYEPGPMLEDVEVRRDAHGSPRLRARIAPNRKAWRDFLGEAEAREVEDRLADPMSRLGYARYTSPGASAPG